MGKSKKQKQAGEFPPEFLEKLNSVTRKRPRTVIQHILRYGSVTTQELNDIYGYEHAPRAIRDVREEGIPIVTKLTTINGRNMAVYTFGDPSEVKNRSKLEGRSRFADQTKAQLIEKYGAKDFIYLVECDPKKLQIDHRIPFEIGGEGDESEGCDRYMLLSASANRLKSHSCENCPNWTTRDPAFCRKCFWAYPEKYEHVAGEYERFIMLRLSSQEQIEQWDELCEEMGIEEAQSMLADQVFAIGQ